MQDGGRDLFETSPGGHSAGRSRRHWLASGALCLALLSLAACAGTTGAESADALEEREADAKAEEEGNRRD